MSEVVKMRGSTECWKCNHRWAVDSVVRGAFVRGEDCPKCGDGQVKVWDECSVSMRFKCMNDTGYESRLTEGKAYSPFHIDDEFIIVELDDGTKCKVFADRFEEEQDNLLPRLDDDVSNLSSRFG